MSHPRILPKAARIGVAAIFALALASGVTSTFVTRTAHAASSNARIALTVQNHWSADQDNCADLYPTSTAPTNPPSDPYVTYGQTLTNIFNNNAPAHWSYDGTHSITACSNGNTGNVVYGGPNGNQISLSGEAYYTGGYGAAWQCMELIARYAYSRWGYNPQTSWPGFASDAWNTYPGGSDFTRVDNGSSTAPQPGDIIIYGHVDQNGVEPYIDSGYVGHIAIITSVNYKDNINGYPTVTIMEQNFTAAEDPAGGWPRVHAFHKEYLRVLNGKYTIGQGADSDENYSNPIWNDQYGFTSRFQKDDDNVVYGWLHNKYDVSASNPTYNSHDVYVIGSDQHLYQDQYADTYDPNTQTTHWHWAMTDLSVASNSTATLLTGSASGDFSGGVHFVYAIGAADGHLYEFYPNSSGVWGIHDLSANFASGATFQGSPQSYSFTDPATQALHHIVNVITTGGDFATFDYTSGGNWVYSDVSGNINGSITFSGAMSGFADISASPYVQQAYGVGSDGKLYEYRYTNSAWALQNAATLSSTVHATRAPSAYSFIGSNGTAYNVFVEGSNSNLYNLTYDSTGALTGIVNVSSVAGESTISVGGSPSAHVSYQGSTIHFVYLADHSGNLDEFYSIDGSGKWNYVGLGTSGSGVTVTGSPWAYSYLGQGATNTTHIIFFTESDGGLHEKNYTTSWANVGLGAPSGASFSGASTNAYGYSS